jgi:hypothetical protein
MVRATRSTRWKPRADSRIAARRRRAACGRARRASRPRRAARRRPRHWCARHCRCSARTGPRAPRRPARDFGAALRPAAAGQVGGADPWHVDVQVDAVEQRPRHLGLIIGGAARRAAAGQRRIAEMAAAARVHRRDQLDPRREGDVGVGAGDADACRSRAAGAANRAPARWNSGSSSRNSTPRCARLISPGRTAARRRPAPASRRCGAARGTAAGGGSAAVQLAGDRGDHRHFERFDGSAAAGCPAGRRRAATCPRPAARSSADCGRRPRRSRARAWRPPGP